MSTNLPFTVTNHLVDKKCSRIWTVIVSRIWKEKKSVYAVNRSFFFLLSVEDMIKEVDVDGDGRIDFYGKISSTLYTTTRFRENATRAQESTKKGISISTFARSILEMIDGVISEREEERNWREQELFKRLRKK